MMSNKRFPLAAKRCLDVVGAGTALVLLAPLMVGVAVTIRVTMGSPVLFRQVRPGRNGVPFTILKYRTMSPPDKADQAWFRTDRERLTPLGRWLRKTSIDELPELLNVLRGEMSLVGPRPLLVEYLTKYTPNEARRHEVRPGITGWAQVNGRQALKFSERLKLDVWYVDNWSLLLDVKILVLTVKHALRGAGVESGQDVDDVDDIGLSADKIRVPQ